MKGTSTNELMSQVPYIPNSAPFTPEQRAWLNGYLTGLFADANVPQLEVGATPARLARSQKPDPLLVMYGSQTGTAEQLARRFAKDAGKRSTMFTEVTWRAPATLMLCIGTMNRGPSRALTESADQSDALQTLRALRRRPAVANRLECVRLQRRLPKPGWLRFDDRAGSWKARTTLLLCIGTLNLTVGRNLFGVPPSGGPIINERSFYDLPRKFNIAFDGGGMIGTVEDTNDIGVKAVRVVPATSVPRDEPTPIPSPGGELLAARPIAVALPGGVRGESVSPTLRSDDQVTDAIPSGIYFRLSLGGATGHKAFARELGVLVRPEELLKVLVAVIRVYIAHGNRSDRKEARLKHLLESWSLEKYLEETEKLLGYKLLRAPAAVAAEVTRRTGPQDNNHSDPPSHGGGYGHSHVGVFPQKQPGLNWIGVAVPVGNITPKQMLRLADLSDNYGSGEVRLTVWQNLILPNIPDAFVETVKKALVKMGLHWEQSNLRSGLVACTGSDTRHSIRSEVPPMPELQPGFRQIPPAKAGNRGLAPRHRTIYNSASNLCIQTHAG
jgi:hypothetical protein